MYCAAAEPHVTRALLRKLYDSIPFIQMIHSKYKCCTCIAAEPYVTKALLRKLFGPELAAEAAARYFIEGQGPGGYRFRPEYYSEKVRLVSKNIRFV